MFWFFWPRGMWDLTSLTRNWIRTPCIGRWSLNHWTAREVPSLPLKKIKKSRFQRWLRGSCVIHISEVPHSLQSYFLLLRRLLARSNPGWRRPGIVSISQSRYRGWESGDLSQTMWLMSGRARLAACWLPPQCPCQAVRAPVAALCPRAFHKCPCVVNGLID